MTRAPADLLERAVSPAEAVDRLGKRGVKISERTLREKARRIGAYRELGQAMFFLPEDLEKIMEPQSCSRRKRNGTLLDFTRISDSSRLGALEECADEHYRGLSVLSDAGTGD